MPKDPETTLTIAPPIPLQAAIGPSGGATRPAPQLGHDWESVGDRLTKNISPSHHGKRTRESLRRITLLRCVKCGQFKTIEPKGFTSVLRTPVHCRWSGLSDNQRRPNRKGDQRP
jgi:hypothetical protein